MVGETDNIQVGLCTPGVDIGPLFSLRREAARIIESGDGDSLICIV